MPKNKLITIQCLSFCDIGLALYTYFLLSDFTEFKTMLSHSAKLAKVEDMITPDFQLEFYKMFLHTLTFLVLSVVVIHLVIYFFYYREKKFAQLYVRYYSALAALSLLVSSYLMKQFIFLIPTAIYAVGFMYSKKVDTKTAG
jgi:hypothetical protein